LKLASGVAPDFKFTPVFDAEYLRNG